ncbi:hypothetical protein [Merdimonas faecis]|uniref:hypothetical protein n=1 Tax=Merdimonas faecis TaxID=1653435 RepID=UPI0022E0AB00|nr:hypothetical protein [Merdimonas faecis]
MKRWMVVLSGILVLILPFVGIGVARCFFGKNIFDNPDFWYGYMAYFGTVSLAIVSLIQNVNTKEINDKFMIQQLRQKLGYFDLKEESGDARKFRKYRPLQVGQFLDVAGNDNRSKDKNLGIWLVNVGEDLMLNVQASSAKINGGSVEVPCSINVIYKSEEICFELENERCFQEEKLNIEFSVQMENSAGIIYRQHFCIQAKKASVTSQAIYLVEEFDTSIDF